MDIGFEGAKIQSQLEAPPTNHQEEYYLTVITDIFDRLYPPNEYLF